MIELFNKASGEKLASITEDQLDFLVDHFEEDAEEESAYIISRDAVEYLAKHGAPSDLIELLRGLLGASKSVEIEYHIVDEVEFDYDEEE